MPVAWSSEALRKLYRKTRIRTRNIRANDVTKSEDAATVSDGIINGLMRAPFIMLLEQAYALCNVREIAASLIEAEAPSD
eukprot:scaffold253038_cov37-Prasinocladus_malaysianus.AAC.2